MSFTNCAKSPVTALFLLLQMGCTSMRPSSDYQNPLGGIWKIEGFSCPSSKPLDSLAVANQQYKTGQVVHYLRVLKDTATDDITSFGSANGNPTTCKTIRTSKWQVTSSEIVASDTVSRSITDGASNCSGETQEPEARTHSYKRDGNSLVIVVKPRPTSKEKSDQACEDDTIALHYIRVK